MICRGAVYGLSVRPVPLISQYSEINVREARQGRLFPGHAEHVIHVVITFIYMYGEVRSAVFGNDEE